MTDDTALLEAIYQDPESDAPRLVYADVLLERGDPRGELIQLQCALARGETNDHHTGELRKREGELLEAHGSKWLPRSRPGARFFFVRGFVGGVQASAPAIAKHHEKWRHEAPLLSSFDVDLSSYGEDPAEALEIFARSNVLATARALTLSSGYAKRRARLEPFRRTPPCPNLRSLTLDGVGVMREDVDALVSAPCFGALRDLSVTMCRLGKSAHEPFVSARAPLERFTFMTYHAGPTFGAALSTAPAFAQLRRLVVPGNEIGDDALDALARAGRLRAVEDLDLCSNALGAKAIGRLLDPGALARTGALAQTRRLRLGGNPIGDSGAAAIASWPGAEHLEELHLGSAKIGDRGALALARSPHLANLRSLVLSFTKLKPSTEAELLASRSLAKARLYVNKRFLSRKGERATR